MDINQLIEFCRDNDASDLHLTQEGREIGYRRYGELKKMEHDMDSGDVDGLILSILNENQKADYNRGKDLDFSYQTPSGIRCRVNTYHQRGSHAACLRLMGDSVPEFEKLSLPPVIRTLADKPRGLVLVTGPTGSGKSTTLASMIDYINRTRAEHILTIEDPIEYMYTPGKSTIHQREVGRDVDSFAGALRSALREDPDVILVGEMRDYETISAAVTAAETGHLVMSTLHTTGVADTVDRIIDVFPPHSQNQIRTQLASVLQGVVTQNLIRRADGNGRVVATEILIGTEAVCNLIRQGKTFQIESQLQVGQNDGMHSLNMDLTALVMKGIITKEMAIARSNNPKELNLF
ncbi:MAG: type IV pilus twitching motility protein PilT [Lachnospiraceae bacterium]|nr:type IV pilus twitching motility protein PilT [Lachnospiraceae bacterium]